MVVSSLTPPLKSVCLYFSASHNGWPVLQAQVLKDFVFLSRRRREDVLAIRYENIVYSVFHHILRSVYRW